MARWHARRQALGLPRNLFLPASGSMVHALAAATVNWFGQHFSTCLQKKNLDKVSSHTPRVKATLSYGHDRKAMDVGQLTPLAIRLPHFLEPIQVLTHRRIDISTGRPPSVQQARAPRMTAPEPEVGYSWLPHLERKTWEYDGICLSVFSPETALK